MTTKVIANVGLMAAGLALMLGNYWYTFGLWPRNWWAFVLFGVGNIVLLLLRTAIEKENK
jgi:hypothetical protein